MRERIRTPDTLVRSQVLYPAELRTRITVVFLNSDSQYISDSKKSQAFFKTFFIFFGQKAAPAFTPSYGR